MNDSLEFQLNEVRLKIEKLQDQLDTLFEEEAQIMMELGIDE